MESRKPIRVLIVDDSTVVRALLRMALTSSPEIEVTGIAADGFEGVEAAERLRPDLVLLDIEMPRMDGLQALVEMRRRCVAAKVIMCSTLTRRGAGITLEALACGAHDYVAKPATQHGVRESVESLRRELLPKITALFSGSHRRAIQLVQSPVLHCARQAPVKVLAIGVSTGGPAALEALLPALPADFPVPVLIVQHMPPVFTALLAERLDGLSRIRVREAIAGEALRPGVANLARGDWHIQVAGSAVCCSLWLTQAPPEHYCRPSVDVLFRSVAAVYGAGSLAVVLTGMGSDGLEGCRAIRAAEGRILVQDRETSAVWGMPGAVAEAGLADLILPLPAMAAELVRSTMRYAHTQSA